MENREPSERIPINVDETEQVKKSREIDLACATAMYERLVTKYESAPPGTKLSRAEACADIGELWRAMVAASGRCPCIGSRCHHLGADCPVVVDRCCDCDAPLCECCIDSYLADHDVDREELGQPPRPRCACGRRRVMLCCGLSLCSQCVGLHLGVVHGPMPPHREGRGVCTGCAREAEELGSCVCRRGICEHCVDDHFGDHGW